MNFRLQAPPLTRDVLGRSRALGGTEREPPSPLLSRWRSGLSSHFSFKGTSKICWFFGGNDPGVPSQSRNVAVSNGKARASCNLGGESSAFCVMRPWSLGREFDMSGLFEGRGLPYELAKPGSYASFWLMFPHFLGEGYLFLEYFQNKTGRTPKTNRDPLLGSIIV